MTSKGFKALFLAVLLIVPLITLSASPDGGQMQLSLLPQSIMEGSFSTEFAALVNEKLPRAWLRQLGLDLRLWGGQKEQNGIFISKNALMKNIDPPNEFHVRENITAIAEFSARARAVGCSTYFALIPTSGAILQENLPRFAPSQMINQRQFIEDVYSQLGGSVVTIDAYTALFNRRNQYIYYRTENNLTALGGYYVYTAMSNRLDESGSGSGSMSHFDIQYATNSYYGDLYAESPYKDIRPDTLSLFRYSRQTREYTVTHTRGGEKKTYHTLYPLHTLELGRPMDVYLGGISAVTDIQSFRSSGSGAPSILVFGDKTALAYVPFLASYYNHVTVVDLFRNPDDYADIQPEKYSQILFAYGVESFMYWNNPSRASLFPMEE